MRVLVAARLSQVRRPGDDGKGAQTGIESQDRLTVDALKAQGHTVVAVVADTKSGTVQPWKRPNLRPWVTKPDKIAQYDAIAGYRLDRLTRGDNASTNEIEAWANSNHKRLITEDGLMFPCEGADGIRWDLAKRLAHEEWLKISERYRRMQAFLRSENKLTGRPTYGLHRIDSGEHSTLAPYEPQAEVIREASRRYLAGETIQAICNDLDARGIPGPGLAKDPVTKKSIKGKRCKWSAKTLAGLLRNSAIAGRRQDASGKTILTYEGIITWQDHLSLVARLDSRAHRKGISPKNVALLTSTLFDASGHPMYPWKLWQGPGYYCRICKLSADMAELDSIANESVMAYGDMPHMILTVVPGQNHQDEIDQLRQDRADLDDIADDYDQRHADLTAKIRELVKTDTDNPAPDTVKRIPSGKTVGQVWQAMDTASKRDWLMGQGWRFNYGGPGVMGIETGGLEADLEALGFPVMDYLRFLSELPARLGIKP